MIRTLYARLAMVLVILLTAIGMLYALISTSATRHYTQEVSQRFNKDLARNLVADRNLVEEGRLNETALRETFHEYMVINPSIEIYLLDLTGKILSYSADPGKVKRMRVSLEPVRAFLQGDQGYPLLGDDPRSHDRRKAFSVTPVPSAENAQGYLYVVLRGEEYDSVDRMIQESYFLRLSGWAVAASLGFGLLAGLVIFHILTRRLHRLAAVMDAFHGSNFTSHIPYEGQQSAAADEVDRLGTTFDRMAERIIAQFNRLQENDALRRELVAQVSHDLRTPLASLQGYLETLKLKGTSLTDEQRTEYLDIALRHSERLTRLVAELFELANLDAREITPQCEPFAAAELAQDVVQKFSLRAVRDGIRLTLARASELPLVSADVALTERVLENLLANALDHTPEGGEVRVSLEPNAGSVVVRVSDTGAGISKTDLPHIFAPFYRAETRRPRRDEHAGLGLAIAKRIVDLQGGEIQAQSRPGAGATFAFSLSVWRR